MSQSIKGAGAESGFRTMDSIAGLICWLAEQELHHLSLRNPITCDYCSFICLLVHCDPGNTGLEVINLMVLDRIHTLMLPLAAAEITVVIQLCCFLKTHQFNKLKSMESILACAVKFSYMLPPLELCAKSLCRHSKFCHIAWNFDRFSGWRHQFCHFLLTNSQRPEQKKKTDKVHFPSYWPQW